MKRDKLMNFTLVLVCICTLSLAAISVTSCDTPRSIAWSYYYCAKDTLAAGDPFAAKHFLESCNKTADKTLAIKADSLMKAIEDAIVEKEH